MILTTHKNGHVLELSTAELNVLRTGLYILWSNENDELNDLICGMQDDIKIGVSTGIEYVDDVPSVELK